MINSIIEAVSNALREKFGDGYEIYMEEIEQDLEEPCFFIQCLNPANELFMGRKYLRRNQFCIQYFPLSEDDRNRECYDVLERLNQCLEYIDMDVDGLMRGTQMNGKVVDGVLNFFVNFDCFVYKREETTKMEQMIPHTTVKEGD